MFLDLQKTMFFPFLTFCLSSNFFCFFMTSLSFQNIQFWKLLYLVFFLFFSVPKFKTFNISAISKAIIFSVILPMVNIHKFCKEEILIQPPVFSKMRQTILTLPVILSFLTFFVAQTSRTLFFFN